ncbi:hypothetical protein BH09BAC1_BH09BAC1_07240 [soil metagenome]
MLRMLVTLIAMAGMAVAVNAQTTQYRLQGTTAQLWDGAIWLSTDSTAYHYSQGEVDTLVGQFAYNSLNAAWDKYTQNITTYDAQGNETQNLTLVWDGTVFLNYRKLDFTYDAQNLLSTDTRHNWDGANWEPYLRTTYTYNAQGQTLTRLTELYASGVGWANSERSQYAYTNGQLEVFENQLWSSGIWQKQLRIVYTYDANGNTIKKLGQNWVAPAYQNNYMYLYTFDANNNILTDAYIDWVSGAWDSISRRLYSYNTNNQNDTVFNQRWDDGSSTPRWLTEERDITLYNGQGLPDTLKHQEYIGLAYIDDVFVTKLEYDANGNKIRATTTERSGSVMVNQSRQFYYYEPYTITGIAHAQPEVAITVYPNPFAEKLCFTLPVEAQGPIEITLFDMAGRRVMHLSQPSAIAGQPLALDASHLPCGQYVYQLTLGGKRVKGLVVK